MSDKVNLRGHRMIKDALMNILMVTLNEMTMLMLMVLLAVTNLQQVMKYLLV